MRSRQNALSHGLTGKAVVIPDDFPELAERRAELAARLQPRDLIEEEFVERMALASIRMRRCVRVDLARTARLEAEIPAPGEPAGPTGLDLAIANFQKGHDIEPLVATSAGCAWLITQWEKLQDKLNNEPRMWLMLETERAIKLTGNDPFTSYTNEARVIQLRKCLDVIFDTRTINSCRGSLEKEQPHTQRHEDLSRQIEGVLKKLDGVTVPDVLASVAGLIASEIEELKRKQSHLHDEVEVPGAASAQVEALIDITPEGARLHRYENMNELAYHRNYNAFLRHRRNAEKLLPALDESSESGQNFCEMRAAMDEGDAGHSESAGAQNEPTEKTSSLDSTVIYASSDLPSEPTEEPSEGSSWVREPEADDEEGCSEGATDADEPPPTV